MEYKLVIVVRTDLRGTARKNKFYVKKKYVNNLRYYLSLGDSGIIGNYYFFIDDYEESIFLIHYLSD